MVQTSEHEAARSNTLQLGSPSPRAEETRRLITDWTPLCRVPRVPTPSHALPYGLHATTRPRDTSQSFFFDNTQVSL